MIKPRNAPNLYRLFEETCEIRNILQGLQFPLSGHSPQKVAEKINEISLSLF